MEKGRARLLSGGFALIMVSNYLLQSLRDAHFAVVGRGVSSRLLSFATFGSLFLTPEAKRVARDTVTETACAMQNLYRWYAFVVLCGFAIRSPSQGEEVTSMQIAAISMFVVVTQSANNLIISLMWSFAGDLLQPDESSVAMYSTFGAASTLGQAAGSLAATMLLSAGFQVHYIAIFVALAIEGAARFARAAAVEKRQVSNPKPQQSETTEEKKTKDGKEENKESSRSMAEVMLDPLNFLFAAFTLCYASTMSMIFLERTAVVVRSGYSAESAASISANMSLVAAAVTLFVQLVLAKLPSSGFLSVRFGLLSLPLVSAAGFVSLLSTSPSSHLRLPTVVAFELIRRVVAFAVSKPVRESMYSVLEHRERFVVKSVLDTFLYRGGMGLGALLFDWAASAESEYGEKGFAIMYIVVSMVWIISAVLLHDQWASRPDQKFKHKKD